MLLRGNEMETNKKTFHNMSITETLKTLGSDEKGITNEEATRRLKKYGENTITKGKKANFFKTLIKQIKDLMVFILFSAAVLSFFLGDYIEGYVILAIIIIDIIVGVTQELKADSALEALQKISSPNAKVIRDNHEYIIPSQEVTIGDIVHLEDGYLVPADCRLIKSFSLRIQESSLTGEVLPVDKNAFEVLDDNVALADRINMAYASSLVSYGHGYGVVTAIGMETEVGKIATLLKHDKKIDTPLNHKLNKVGKVLSLIGIIVCFLILGIGLMYGKSWKPLLLTSIALAISIIPEGLPATATIVLALGVERMAKKNALMRNLASVETLGGVTVICSDKTGTLTTNEMQVKQVISINEIINHQTTFEESIYQEMFKGVSLCSNVTYFDHQYSGDPIEKALVQGAEQYLDFVSLNNEYWRLHEIPFSSERKIMTVVCRNSKELVCYSKGALEILLCKATSYFDGQKEMPLHDFEKTQIIEKVKKIAGESLRVMVVAKKNLYREDYSHLEENFMLLGVFGIVDPPRLEVKDSIKICKEAGIKPVIVTGDYLMTAVAIGKEVGIVQDRDRFIDGETLQKMSDGELETQIQNYAVFSRVTPQDKYRIVSAFQKKGAIVAMTGDGVNDAPALKKADIGCAMGKSGTDVAKDAAELVLLDDNFKTIVDAIYEGRKVYKNIQKVIQFLLAGNIAEIMTLFIATLCNFKFAPLSALQILWVNLATDTLPALSLGVDPASERIMKEKPVNANTLFDRAVVLRVIAHGLIICMVTLLAYFIGYTKNVNLGMLPNEANRLGQTMAFIVLSFSQLLHAFNQRSNYESIFSSKTKNIPLFFATVASSCFILLIVLVPALQNLFGFHALSLREWIIVATLSLTPLAIVEISKIFLRMRLKRVVAKKNRSL